MGGFVDRETDGTENEANCEMHKKPKNYVTELRKYDCLRLRKMAMIVDMFVGGLLIPNKCKQNKLFNSEKKSEKKHFKSIFFLCRFCRIVYWLAIFEANAYRKAVA